MFYVTSKDLPTVAMLTSTSRAYAFKNMLVKQGFQASLIQVERKIKNDTQFKRN